MMLYQLWVLQSQNVLLPSGLRLQNPQFNNVQHNSRNVELPITLVIVLLKVKWVEAVVRNTESVHLSYCPACLHSLGGVAYLKIYYLSKSVKHINIRSVFSMKYIKIRSQIRAPTAFDRDLN